MPIKKISVLFEGANIVDELAKYPKQMKVIEDKIRASLAPFPAGTVEKAFKSLDDAYIEAESIFPLFEHGMLSDFVKMKPVSGLTLLTICSMINDDSRAKATEILGSIEAKRKTKIGTMGADALHNQPGGSREKGNKIRQIWATGKYTTRDICAEKEWEALGYKTYGTARKALRNTPEPDRKK